MSDLPATAPKSRDELAMDLHRMRKENQRFAARIEELEGEARELPKNMRVAHGRIRTQEKTITHYQAENKRLREALGFAVRDHCTCTMGTSCVYHQALGKKP